MSLTQFLLHSLTSSLPLFLTLPLTMSSSLCLSSLLSWLCSCPFVFLVSLRSFLSCLFVFSSSPVHTSLLHFFVFSLLPFSPSPCSFFTVQFSLLNFQFLCLSYNHVFDGSAVVSQETTSVNISSPQDSPHLYVYVYMDVSGRRTLTSRNFNPADLRFSSRGFRNFMMMFDYILNRMWLWLWF